MEKKKFLQGHNRLWPLSGSGNFFKSFFRRTNIKNNSFAFGFTLVELIVVITILSILFVALAYFISPAKQIQKARDAQREHDLKQIQNALNIYYNDHNCFPLELSVLETDPIYMAEVPVDPKTHLDYPYMTDGGSCPQWFSLFDSLEQKDSNSASCVLESFSGCLPQNYGSESGYNSCEVGGQISDTECGDIVNYVIPSVAPTPIPNTPTPTLTPTPVADTPTPSCSKDYSCTGNPPHCSIIGGPGQNLGNYCESNCQNICQ